MSFELKRVRRGRKERVTTDALLFGNGQVCNAADNTCTLQQPHFLGRDEFGYAQFRYEEVIMPCDDATPVSYLPCYPFSPLSLLTPHNSSSNNRLCKAVSVCLNTELTYMHEYSAARNATTAAGTKTPARSSATAPQTYVDSPTLIHPHARS